MKIKGVFLAAILTAVLCFSGNLLAYSGDGDGSAESPYQISTIEDWQELMTTPNDWSSSFILTADVNLTGLTFTQAPIAPDTDNVELNSFQGTQFTGVFDGNGHTISNLTIAASTKDYIGLFGYVGSGGQIRNLGVEDVNLTGRYVVGGLVGANEGISISNCYSTGTVSGVGGVGGLVGFNLGASSRIENCYATGTVSGTGEYSSVGGLVGRNDGMLTSCYATGSVSGNHYVGGLVGYIYYGSLTECYATGSVSGTGDHAGGLVGYNDSGTLTSCYATGSVSGYYGAGGLVGINDYGSLTECYATGSVSGNWLVGGLTGSNHGDSVSGCFWDINTSGQTTSTGGTGKTTAEMKTLSTFTSAGWDFASVWAMPLGQYPVLFPRQMGDLNSDARVDMQDFTMFAENWLAGT